MIRHHLQSNQLNKKITFEIDQKKLVKAFIYNDVDSWIQYFTGFLYMEQNQQSKIDLKIRFSRHSHLAEIQPKIRYPLQLYTDDHGLYTLIHQNVIKTVEKPEQNLLYLKIGPQGKIIALSFHSKSYCKALLQQLTLMLQNNQSDQMTWTPQNLWFLSQSMKQNLMYVDSVFILQQRIEQFCNFFNKSDKKLYVLNEKHLKSQQQKEMEQFFQIVKNMFLRGNDKIIQMFIENQYYFETILKCLSYNPFGVFYFNYLNEFKSSTIINHSIQQLQNDQFMKKYQILVRIKFLRDVAICTFIEITTEAVFNNIINNINNKILQSLSEPKINLIQKLQDLAQRDQYKYISVFTQIWQIFKTVMQDSQTAIIKEMFYFQWIQNGMFSQTLTAMGCLLKQRQVSDIHPRFWQKWMESMNPMMSYQWNETQKMILHHKSSLNQQKTMDFMNSLIYILANSDSNTKSLILQFVRVQIQVSQNRKQISARYLTYIFDSFVKQSFEYCNNQNDIERYIEFIQKIYVAQPIRTRHFIVEQNLMSSLKPYFNNKFTLIMLLKLLKTFIQVGDTDTFVYLSNTDFYDSVREKYVINQGFQNIISSIFLGIFKAVQSMSNKQGKKYLYRIFFGQSLDSGQTNKDKKLIQQKQIENNFKRSVPVQGFENQMDIQK